MRILLEPVSGSVLKKNRYDANSSFGTARRLVETYDVNQIWQDVIEKINTFELLLLSREGKENAIKEVGLFTEKTRIQDSVCMS